MTPSLAPVLARLRPAAWPPLPPALVKGIAPLLALAAGLTVLVMMLLWRDQSDYKPIFGAREKVAAAEMMAVLDAEGLHYRIHPDSGQVLVRDSDLGRVRMLLAGKGVVAKLPAGLELMDKNDPLGVSQFVQDVRFRRGLEGELAQSIMSFDAVESARVHLAIAKSSSFVVSDGEKSSASVVVALKGGRSLSVEQIAAVINLIAGSVASLDPQRISLVDQAGNLLSSRIDLSEGFDGAAASGDAAKRFQDDTRRNVAELLAPVLGGDNFKTSITAEVDNDRVQETHESYGDTPKVTNEATRAESDRAGAAPLGIPGSLSNRPVALAASGAADGGSAQKNAATRQFAYDRNITQIKRSRGKLAKLNVAVVLNSIAAPGGGEWKPEQILGIETLLQTGLGISADRGDKLTVSTMPFPVRVLPGPWWQQRDNIVEIGGWVATVIATLLAFLLVVRPLLKATLLRLAPPVLTPVTPLAGAAHALRGIEPGDAAGAPSTTGHAAARHEMPVVPLLEDYDLPPPGSPVDVLVDHLKVLAAKEPERVAEVVKQWVQKNGKEA